MADLGRVEGQPGAHVPILASDDEREVVIAQIERAVGEGRLTAEEAGGRMAAVYAARHRSQLRGPVADLPPAVEGPGVLSWEELWEQTLWRARLLLDGPRAARPSPSQRRQAAMVVLATVAAAWTAVWVVLGVLAH